MNHFRSSKGILFVLPLLAGVLLFTLIPAGMSVVISLHRWSFAGSPHWVGLHNYAKLLWGGGNGPDPLFMQALGNTLLIATVVPLQVAGSFLLALFLNRRNGWRRFLRLIVFLPTVVSPVALYITWRWVLNSDFGLLAQLLAQVGLGCPAWLDDPFWARPAIMLVIFWETVGGIQMLLFLAGFRQIPEQIFDMATLDGLRFKGEMVLVYWPWLKELVFFNFSLGLLGAMQGGFEIAYIMTGGGPLRSTTTLSYFLFENAFQWQRLGYASALGVIILLLALPILIFSRSYRKGRQGLK